MHRFAEVMSDLILESGKSLRTIGAESGIPHSQLSRYVRNTVPKLDVAMKLSAYFGCSLNYLFGLTEERGKPAVECDVTQFVPRYLKALENNKTTHWKFSHAHNISESGIRIWKHGKIPSMETVAVIAENLSCSIDYLVGAK